MWQSRGHCLAAACGYMSGTVSSPSAVDEQKLRKRVQRKQTGVQLWRPWHNRAKGQLSCPVQTQNNHGGTPARRSKVQKREKKKGKPVTGNQGKARQSCRTGGLDLFGEDVLQIGQTKKNGQRRSMDRKEQSTAHDS